MGPFLVVPVGSSWFSVEEWPWAVLREPYVVPGLELGLAGCKASAQAPVDYVPAPDVGISFSLFVWNISEVPDPALEDRGTLTQE